MASSSRKSTNVLRDSLLRIQTRLQRDEAERQASSSGSQSAALRHLRLTHVIEGKLAIVEELLGSLNSENGQEELRQQQRRATVPTAASVQEEISDQVSSRVAVQCIFTQRNSNSDNPGFPSNNPFRNRQNIVRPSEDHDDPFLSEAEKRRRRMIQNNKNKAATARNAQQKWKDEIQKQANIRREESLKLLADLRKERDKVKDVEEEVRQKALREAAERAAEIAAEAAARAAAEEAERRAREIECAVCFETFDMGVAARLPCMHWYCWEHLEDAFEAALNSRMQFRCCNEPVPVELLANSPTQPEFLDRYLEMILEQSTPNAVYCCQPTCGLFIPPINARGPDEMLCPFCDVLTCRHCKGPGHGDRDCPQDESLQRLNELAGVMRWRNCTRCNAMIERTAGCSRMTCRCGNTFTMY